MAPKTDTREKILDEAERLLGSRGYSGFSYHDISEPLGIRNAAVHYHFPTKADLGVAVIERYRSLLRCAEEEFGAGRATPRDLLEGYIQFFARDDCETQTLCPMGVLTSDYFNLPEAMLETGRHLEKEVSAWLVGILESGRDSGDFRFGGPAEEKALLVMATLQGARQLARMIGHDAMRSIVDQLRDELYADTETRAA